MTAAIENIGGGDPGVCEVFWFGVDEQISCVINKADPQVWIAAEMLYELYFHPDQVHPALRLTLSHGLTQYCGDRQQCCEGKTELCFRAGLLKIEGDNRTVVYRIQSYVPEQNAWLAIWPD